MDTEPAITAEAVCRELDGLGMTDNAIFRHTHVSRQTLRKYRDEGAPRWFWYFLQGLKAAKTPPPWERT